MGKKHQVKQGHTANADLQLSRSWAILRLTTHGHGKKQRSKLKGGPFPSLPYFSFGRLLLTSQVRLQSIPVTLILPQPYEQAEGVEFHTWQTAFSDSSTLLMKPRRGCNCSTRLLGSPAPPMTRHRNGIWTPATRDQRIRSFLLIT